MRRRRKPWPTSKQEENYGGVERPWPTTPRVALIVEKPHLDMHQKFTPPLNKVLEETYSPNKTMWRTPYSPIKMSTILENANNLFNNKKTNQAILQK